MKYVLYLKSAHRYLDINYLACGVEYPDVQPLLLEECDIPYIGKCQGLDMHYWKGVSEDEFLVIQTIDL